MLIVINNTRSYIVQFLLAQMLKSVKEVQVVAAILRRSRDRSPKRSTLGKEIARLLPFAYHCLTLSNADKVSFLGSGI